MVLAESVKDTWRMNQTKNARMTLKIVRLDEKLELSLL